MVGATLLDAKIAGLLPAGEVVDSEAVAVLEARDLLFARLLQYRAFKVATTWFADALAVESARHAHRGAIREHQLPLYSLETFTPLCDCDERPSFGGEL